MRISSFISLKRRNNKIKEREWKIDEITQQQQKWNMRKEKIK